MNSVDKQYFDLIRHIKEHGVEKLDRTGTGTKSVFSYDMRFNMQEGFPLMTSKKMAWKTMVTELLWFLRGDTNIKYLVDNGCHIWNGDAYKNYVKNGLERKYIGSKCSLCANISNHDTDYPNEYDIKCIHCGKNDKWEHIYENIPSLSKEEFIERIKTDVEFAKKWGELGPIYGKQWRNWNGKEEQVTNYLGGEINPYFCDCQERFEDGHSKVRKKNQGIDQITNLIKDLKTNPDSRRLMVSAWNPGESDSMVLPPCHYGFQCYTREMSTEERNKWYFDTAYQNPKYKVDWKDYELDQQNVPKRKLSLKFNMRSTDVPLGLPFNIASYGLLLHLLAKEVNMIPDELIFSGGDCHIYLNQMEGITQQLKQQTYKLPTVEIANKSIFDMAYDDIRLLNYQSAPIIKMPLSN